MVKTSLDAGIILAMQCLYFIFVLCIIADSIFYIGACLEDSGFIIALIGSGPQLPSLIIMVQHILSANRFFDLIDDFCFYIFQAKLLYKLESAHA